MVKEDPAQNTGTDNIWSIFNDQPKEISETAQVASWAEIKKETLGESREEKIEEYLNELKLLINLPEVSSIGIQVYTHLWRMCLGNLTLPGGNSSERQLIESFSLRENRTDVVYNFNTWEELVGDLDLWNHFDNWTGNGGNTETNCPYITISKHTHEWLNMVRVSRLLWYDLWNTGRPWNTVTLACICENNNTLERIIFLYREVLSMMMPMESILAYNNNGIKVITEKDYINLVLLV